MLRELLNKKCLIRLDHVELDTLQEPSDDAEIEMSARDSVEWEKKPDSICVKCTRTVKFEPECAYKVTATYSVEHFLNEENALDEIPDNEIDEEIQKNISFYIQERKGLLNRISLVIAQLTSSFNGVPVVTPPYYLEEDYNV